MASVNSYPVIVVVVAGDPFLVLRESTNQRLCSRLPATRFRKWTANILWFPAMKHYLLRFKAGWSTTSSTCRAGKTHTGVWCTPKHPQPLFSRWTWMKGMSARQFEDGTFRHVIHCATVTQQLLRKAPIFYNVCSPRSTHPGYCPSTIKWPGAKRLFC